MHPTEPWSSPPTWGRMADQMMWHSSASTDGPPRHSSWNNSASNDVQTKLAPGPALSEDADTDDDDLNDKILLGFCFSWRRMSFSCPSAPALYSALTSSSSFSSSSPASNGYVVWIRSMSTTEEARSEPKNMGTVKIRQNCQLLCLSPYSQHRHRAKRHACTFCPWSHSIYFPFCF